MRRILVIFLIVGATFTYNSCTKPETPAVIPVACFTITPTVSATDIHVGDVITFSSSCSQNATGFAWDFGDGSTSTDANPTHTYTAVGNLTVKLTVTAAGISPNTKTQAIVVLEAAIPPGNLHSGNITANETWAEGIHEITGDVYVDGAILTIAPGTIVKVDAGKGLYIGYNGGTAGSTLIANGTAAKGIVFTSAATTKTAGDWYFVGFYSGASANSSMKFVTVEFAGGYSAGYGAINLEQATVTIENSLIKNSKYSGITLNGTAYFKSFVSDTIREIADYPIEIYGNNAHTIGLNNTITTDKGVRVVGDTYTQANKTWNKLTCPYILDGGEYIENATGAKLTLAPGVKIEFTMNSGIYVGYTSNTFGTLVAEGTATDSIYFTSAAPVGSKAPGDWYYVGFYQGAGTASLMKYCAVEFGGGYSPGYGEVYIVNSAVKIDNSSVRNSKQYGVNCDGEGRFGSFTNNNVSGNLSNPVQLYANFAHTIGTGNTYDDQGILLTGATIGATVTWKKQSTPYIINGDVYVESNAGNTLTIEAGTTVKFTHSSGLYIGYSGGTAGNLVAQGTANDKILFTSAAPAGNQSAGDWTGIWFDSGTGANSIMDLCTVSFAGGYSSTSGDISVNGTIAGRPTISNCVLSSSAAYGIYINPGDSPTLSNNTFVSNALGDTN
jgi:parallel beta-helix repeat protein